MIEALWSVEFFANTQGFGAGVVVVENGKVLGGDSQFFYVGECAVEHGVLKARAVISHYSGPGFSIFGPANKYTISVSGTPAHDKFELHGHVVENPQLKINIKFTRRAELP